MKRTPLLVVVAGVVLLAVGIGLMVSIGAGFAVIGLGLIAIGTVHDFEPRRKA